MTDPPDGLALLRAVLAAPESEARAALSAALLTLAGGGGAESQDLC